MSSSFADKSLETESSRVKRKQLNLWLDDDDISFLRDLALERDQYRQYQRRTIKKFIILLVLAAGIGLFQPEPVLAWCPHGETWSECEAYCDNNWWGCRYWCSYAEPENYSQCTDQCDNSYFSCLGECMVCAGW